MNIHTLVYNESHSADMVKTYLSRKECFEGMVSHIEEKLRVKIDRSELAEILESGKDYEKDGLIIGKTYACSDCYSHNWELFVTDIPESQIGRAMIIDAFFRLYPNCKKFENLLNDMVGEYSEEYISKVLSGNDMTIFINSFINEDIIGCCLYQRAAAELGGKTDEKSTSTIFEFFNTDLDLFFDREFRVDGVKWNDGDNYTAHEYWVYAMLSICSGDEEVVKKTRKYIDIKNHTNIFFDVEDYENVLCKDHRNKSSKLTDEQYGDIVRQIVTNDIAQCAESNYRDRVRNLWNEMVADLYGIAEKQGIDFVLDKFSKIVEVVKVNADGFVRYELDITATCDELACQLDKVKQKLGNE